MVIIQYVGIAGGDSFPGVRGGVPDAVLEGQAMLERDRAEARVLRELSKTE